MVAFTGLRIVCNIILLITIHEPNGKVMNCQRKAAAPTAITSGSPLRNRETISSANPMPASAHTSKKMNPTFTQNQNP